MAERVKTRIYKFPEPFELLDGSCLHGAQLAYESWGELNAEKSNAVMVFHALSGSQHASGENEEVAEANGLWQEELYEGWWESFIGPGKAIDTNEFFVICFNYLGGCYGSTGPASIEADTGKPYGSLFPHVTVRDQVEAAVSLLDRFGIEVLHAVVGPSVGGLCALTYAGSYPERVRNVVSIASGYKTTVLNRLILFEQILAIENDPYFNGGDYYEDVSRHPTLGLALARMISHKTFVHIDAFEQRARSKIVPETEMLSWYGVRDTFQSYMLHQGKKFVKRFDANTYLRIADMWSHFNPFSESGAKTPEEFFARCKEAGHKFLVFSIDSDYCFYPEEQKELVKFLEAADISTTYITVHSDKGHDSFLLEPELYTPHMNFVLKS